MCGGGAVGGDICVLILARPAFVAAASGRRLARSQCASVAELLAPCASWHAVDVAGWRCVSDVQVFLRPGRWVGVRMMYKKGPLRSVAGFYRLE